MTTPLTLTSKPNTCIEYKAWGLKQVTIGTIVGLSPGRVSQILSQGL